MGIGLSSRRPDGLAVVVAATIAAVLVAGVLAVALHGDGGEGFEAASGTARLSPGTTAGSMATATPLPPEGQPPPEVFGPTAPPSSGMSTVAQAVGPQVGIYTSAGDPEPQQTLDDPQPSGAPLVFLVRQRQPEWLEVLLPIRPNGSTGWVRQSDVTLTQHDFAIVVELAAHRVTVFKAGQAGFQEPVGLGTASTPTPGGLYYVKELLQPPDPNTVYGAYAYGLSGFSNVITSFEGGEGVIGLHGTNDPSSLGRDVSAGCIRMSNEAITRLVGVLPLGTPVEIRP